MIRLTKYQVLQMHKNLIKQYPFNRFPVRIYFQPSSLKRPDSHMV